MLLFLGLAVNILDGESGLPPSSVNSSRRCHGALLHWVVRSPLCVLEVCCVHRKRRKPNIQCNECPESSSGVIAITPGRAPCQPLCQSPAHGSRDQPCCPAAAGVLAAGGRTVARVDSVWNVGVFQPLGAVHSAPVNTVTCLLGSIATDFLGGCLGVEFLANR